MARVRMCVYGECGWRKGVGGIEWLGVQCCTNHSIQLLRITDLLCTVTVTQPSATSVQLFRNFFKGSKVKKYGEGGRKPSWM